MQQKQKLYPCLYLSFLGNLKKNPNQTIVRRFPFLFSILMSKLADYTYVQYTQSRGVEGFARRVQMKLDIQIPLHVFKNIPIVVSGSDTVLIRVAPSVTSTEVKIAQVPITDVCGDSNFKKVTLGRAYRKWGLIHPQLIPYFTQIIEMINKSDVGYIVISWTAGDVETDRLAVALPIDDPELFARQVLSVVRIHQMDCEHVVYIDNTAALEVTCSFMKPITEYDVEIYMPSIAEFLNSAYRPVYSLTDIVEALGPLNEYINTYNTILELVNTKNKTIFEFLRSHDIHERLTGILLCITSHKWKCTDVLRLTTDGEVTLGNTKYAFQSAMTPEEMNNTIMQHDLALHDTAQHTHRVVTKNILSHTSAENVYKISECPDHISANGQNIQLMARPCLTIASKHCIDMNVFKHENLQEYGLWKLKNLKEFAFPCVDVYNISAIATIKTPTPPLRIITTVIPLIVTIPDRRYKPSVYQDEPSVYIINETAFANRFDISGQLIHSRLQKTFWYFEEGVSFFCDTMYKSSCALAEFSKMVLVLFVRIMLSPIGAAGYTQTNINRRFVEWFNKHIILYIDITECIQGVEDLRNTRTNFVVLRIMKIVDGLFVDDNLYTETSIHRILQRMNNKYSNTTSEFMRTFDAIVFDVQDLHTIEELDSELMPIVRVQNYFASKIAQEEDIQSHNAWTFVQVGGTVLSRSVVNNTNDELVHYTYNNHIFKLPGHFFTPLSLNAYFTKGNRLVEKVSLNAFGANHILSNTQQIGDNLFRKIANTKLTEQGVLSFNRWLSKIYENKWMNWHPAISSTWILDSTTCISNVPLFKYTKSSAPLQWFELESTFTQDPRLLTVTSPHESPKTISIKIWLQRNDKYYRCNAYAKLAFQYTNDTQNIYYPFVTEKTLQNVCTESKTSSEDITELSDTFSRIELAQPETNRNKVYVYVVIIQKPNLTKQYKM
jgi:hypothetical protein